MLWVQTFSYVAVEIGNVCRVKQRTTSCKKRKWFNRKKSCVAHDVVEDRVDPGDIINLDLGF